MAQFMTVIVNVNVDIKFKCAQDLIEILILEQSH